jgi:Flp pilus assembly protein TadG
MTAVSRSRRSLLRLIRRFRRSERGWVTTFTLVLLIALLGLTGFAVDVSNVMRERTLLQTTADSAAHGAILFRRTMTEAQAKDRAITIATRNMPVASFGNVLNTTNVEFGTWNATTRVFTPQANATEAVRVTTQRRRANGNAVPVFLLQFAGLDVWDVRAVSIFAGGPNPCFFNGIIANGIADMSSNSIFRPGFCVHGNDHVRLRQNNTFEPGSIVSMPDTSEIDIPSSGMSGNPGLAEALRSATVDLSSLSNLSARITAMRAGNADALPAYTTNRTSVAVNNSNVNASTFQSGRNYNVSCNGNGNNGNNTLTLTSSMNLTNVVITTNCSIMLGNGARVVDSMIATTNTSSSSISGTSSSGALATIGPTACTSGPGTQFFTMGGMRFPAKLVVNGGQLAAQGTITFTAGATLEGSGVSVISNGNVEWTSNADMSVAYCDQQFQNHMIERRIRMVG